jgi:hypothetical protein
LTAFAIIVTSEFNCFHDVVLGDGSDVGMVAADEFDEYGKCFLNFVEFGWVVGLGMSFKTFYHFIS